MTNKGTTRRALFMSFVALLLCFTMLLGTTFAWFTDSVSSARNTIVSGNLDVVLEYSTLGDDGKWTAYDTVDENTLVFKDGALYEPGYTEVVKFKVTNAGSLALKYKMDVKIYAETEGTNKAGDTFKLSEYLYLATVDDVSSVADRETAAKAAATKLASGFVVKANEKLEKTNDYDEFIVVLTMPTYVDNEANHINGKQPKIELAIDLFATQLTYEYDSFGNDYDAGASWIGSADTTWYNDTDAEFVIKTAEELAGLASLVNGGNTFEGKTVKLGNDIDLGNRAWTAIGNAATAFKGTFDGQGYTVSNLNVTGDVYAGLFGKTWGATVKNLVVDGATVVTGVDVDDGYAGAVVAYSSSSGITPYITNVTVKNASVTGKNAGAVVGSFLEIGTVSGATVEKCSVSGQRVGGVAGTINADAKAEDLSVKNSTMISTTAFVGNYVGRTGNNVPEGNDTTVENNTVLGNAVLIGTADELVAFSAAVNAGNSYNGKTVMLTADIDLAGVDWIPAGQTGGYSSKTYFQGVFDGNGYTVSNLSVTHHEVGNDNGANYATGLFGFVDAASATIKNVKIDGATVKGSHWVGVLAGFMSGDVLNCTVNNATVIATNLNADANGDKVGGLVGYMNTGNWTVSGNAVTNSKIYGNREVGGVIGTVAVGTTVTGNKVENVEIFYVDNSKYESGEIASARNNFVADATNTATNVTITKLDASDTESLAAAIEAGDTDITLAPGNYTIPSSIAGKTVTLTGSDDGVVFDNTVAYNVGNASITFENIKFQGRNENVMSGFGLQHTTGDILFKNCTFDGAVTSENYTNTTYENCTFTGIGYITTYAAKSVTITNCVFDKADSRAVLVYSHGDNPVAVKVSGCDFKAAGKAYTWNGDWTSAIEVDTTNIKTAGTTVTVDDCTYDANYSGLLRDKSAANATPAVITIDGVAK